MAKQQVYTSVPQGLWPGTSGYCTVLCTSGIPRAVADTLESLSVYRIVDRDAAGTISQTKDNYERLETLNPAAFAFVSIPYRRDQIRVLVKTCLAGFDYSSRLRKMSHFLVLDDSDLAEGGPAWLLSQPRVMLGAWGGQPTMLEEDKALPQGALSPQPCQGWEKCAGDAGWGGLLAETASQEVRKTAYVIYPPGTDTLGLILEAMALLPAHLRWRTTFSTNYVGFQQNVDCQWRFITHDSPDLGLARTRGDVLCIDLTSPLALPAATAAVEAARRGTALENASPAPVTAPMQDLFATEAAAIPLAPVEPVEPVQLMPSGSDAAVETALLTEPTSGPPPRPTRDRQTPPAPAMASPPPVRVGEFDMRIVYGGAGLLVSSLVLMLSVYWLSSSAPPPTIGNREFACRQQDNGHRCNGNLLEAVGPDGEIVSLSDQLEIGAILDSKRKKRSANGDIKLDFGTLKISPNGEFSYLARGDKYDAVPETKKGEEKFFYLVQAHPNSSARFQRSFKPQTATATITVTGVNDPPRRVRNEALIVKLGSNGQVSLSELENFFSDPDGEDFTLQLTPNWGPKYGKFDHVSLTYELNPQAVAKIKGKYEDVFRVQAKGAAGEDVVVRVEAEAKSPDPPAIVRAKRADFKLRGKKLDDRFQQLGDRLRKQGVLTDVELRDCLENGNDYQLVKINDKEVEDGLKIRLDDHSQLIAQRIAGSGNDDFPTLFLLNLDQSESARLLPAIDLKCTFLYYDPKAENRSSDLTFHLPAQEKTTTVVDAGTPKDPVAVVPAKDPPQVKPEPLALDKLKLGTPYPHPLEAGKTLWAFSLPTLTANSETRSAGGGSVPPTAIDLKLVEVFETNSGLSVSISVDETQPGLHVIRPENMPDLVIGSFEVVNNGLVFHWHKAATEVNPGAMEKIQLKMMSYHLVATDPSNPGATRRVQLFKPLEFERRSVQLKEFTENPSFLVAQPQGLFGVFLGQVLTNSNDARIKYHPPLIEASASKLTEMFTKRTNPEALPHLEPNRISPVSVTCLYQEWNPDPSIKTNPEGTRLAPISFSEFEKRVLDIDARLEKEIRFTDYVNVRARYKRISEYGGPLEYDLNFVLYKETPQVPTLLAICKDYKSPVLANGKSADER